MRWPELMAQRELAGVTHLVSTVEGRLRPGVGLAEILRATFPGGSITGAPKIAAVDLIARARAGRPRRVDGRARDDPRERRLRPRADDPHVRGRGRAHPPLGRRRHRLGLRPGGRDRGVVGEGAAAARRGRRARAARDACSPSPSPAAGSSIRPSRSSAPTTRRSCAARAAFETMRVYGGRPFLLDRAPRAARALGRRARAAAAPDGAAELVALVARRGAARPRPAALPHRATTLVATAAALPGGSRSCARAGSRSRRSTSARRRCSRASRRRATREAFAARREAERAAPTTRCSSHGRPCSRRDREHLVAPRRRALHAGRAGRACSPA